MQKLSGWHLRGVTGLALFCATACASAADLGFYAIVDGAYNMAHISLAQFHSQVSLIVDGEIADTGVKTKVKGYDFTVGYQLGTYFAVEGSYFISGKPRYEYTTLPSSDPDAPPPLAGRLKIKAGGPTVSAAGLLPLGDYFSLDGHAGFFFVEDKYDISKGTLSLSGTDSKTSLYAGAGAAWWVTGQVALRAGYNWYHHAMFDEDVSQFTLGIRYSYGY